MFFSNTRPHSSSLLIYFVCISLVVCTLAVEPPRYLTKKSCRIENNQGCKCIFRVKSDCCCMGKNVTVFPADLPQSMTSIVLYDVSIESIAADTFKNYTNLEEIEIVSSSNLRDFDASSLRNLTSLRKLSITGCDSLTEISAPLLVHNHKMLSLILRNNSLKTMPLLEMSDDHKMELEIDLSHNHIQFIGDRRVRNVRAKTLRLNSNHLREIAANAFEGSSFLNFVASHNPLLSELSKDAFKHVHELHNLDLSHTAIHELPTVGLKNVRSLTLRDVPTLKSLPPVLTFTHLQTAHFTYPHHCCLFKHVENVVEGDTGLFKNNSKEIHQRVCRGKLERQRRLRRKRETLANLTATTNTANKTFVEATNLAAFWDAFLKDDGTDEFLETDDEFEELAPFSDDEIGFHRCLAVEEAAVKGFYMNITCTPQPDALNPCENIVGYQLLRNAIWFVWIFAITGNILVWIVLFMVFERRMRVHYFFMINLSVADLITGAYLAILAIQDVRTADEYYRHAVGWQTGLGCKAAGFIAVFASQLSIISMFMIAFEIAYNTRLAFYGKRLAPNVAFAMMAAGYLYSAVMASLPLFGVSSYSTNSICLPLSVEKIVDQVFLISGLAVNMLAFLGMAACYVLIIYMLKNPNTPSRAEDQAVITKMFVLIITDMVCWFPTLFFGITAAMGSPLITISNAKIFLVFFFPINSFANPFLYVFFTKVIQRNVKTKALPMLERMASLPGLSINLNTFSNFYNNTPGKGGGAAGMMSDDQPSSPRAAATQLTSLVDSTPRGSNTSHASHASNGCGPDCNHYERRSTPRVSFQDEVIARASVDMGRRSNGLLKRISAIPEVSDLSEHSSDSHHEHVITPKKTPRTAFSFRRSSLARLRHESVMSFGQDSGRGSMASINTRDARLSLATDESSDEADSVCLVRKQPFHMDRRKSLPATRPLLVVRENSETQPASP